MADMRRGCEHEISIHAPREGCDNDRVHQRILHQLFQSTHPVRGATELVPEAGGYGAISIHAPREGCDTDVLNDALGDIIISIHAPREGCDVGCHGCWRRLAYFNPRTP